MTRPPGTAPAAYWAEHAWLPPGRVAAGVTLTLDAAGTAFAAVTPGTAPPPGAARLPGLVLPGLANAHSHAFHRVLRSRTQRPDPARGAGSFWTWRTLMYRVADRLTPDAYRDLARAVYAEMALAGITRVGEFHYLHHAPGGARYADPNAMGRALADAARDAGVRLTLLDTCYLAAGVDGAPLDGPQLRFGDGDAHAWADRAEALAADPGTAGTLVGAAVHSVRAVPADQLATVAAWAAARGAPLHVHLSEQPAENEACLARHGTTPTGLLRDRGVLGPRTTAVHATHLTADDLAALGETRTGACLCPTTERDLADGIGPARALSRHRAPLSLGSDSHAVIDLFEEARAVELDERLASRDRGVFTAADLLRHAGRDGHLALGDPDAGELAPGRTADLVAVDLRSPRTAGGGPTAETVVFAATAADVTHVVAGGRPVVADRRHLLVDDPPGALAAALADL